jgi:lysophospholipid acyltransferase (LPLAT)-like uncharacterized protein
LRPLRNPVVQVVLAWLVATWLRVCFATIRWTRENEAVAEAIWAAGGGVLIVFWHSRGAVSMVSWPQDRAQPTKGLVSLSRDGEFMVKMVGRLGFPAIRGSSAKKGKDEDKGGTAALREILRQLKVGGLALSPDGPRGPVREMGPGTPVMAKLSKRPVLFLGVSCNPSIRLNTWDRYMLPLPFGRGAVVWDIAHYPEGEEPEVVAAHWQQKLTAVEARADALCGAERL